MTLLPSDDIAGFIDAHPKWTWSDTVIDRTFEFNDFTAAMIFVNRVAQEAEKINHHPDIDIRWNKVTLALSTHSAGGLTKADLDLATICDLIPAS